MILNCVQSVLDSDYPAEKMHVFLSFDGFEERDTFREIVEVLTTRGVIADDFERVDILVREHRMAISMFEHGGKQRCQGNTMAYIKRNHPEYLRDVDGTWVLFIDSDTCVNAESISWLAAAKVNSSR